ncbi:MAG TPA: Gfo/Idh/MocA family oxidoreductase [Steroidobacteraceae bacterium]|nr:Gfo/Idh/MocA family oxidoreductase [Steroidobacteraceae bacterium]
MKPIRLGIVGVGKIARDQHIPAILGNSAFSFAAAASRHAHTSGVANYPSIEEMLAAVPDLDAVAICTPPQVHYAAAKLALAKGKHVLLEKPPCSSLTQFENLARLARLAGRTLYQTWHSRHAHGVAPAQRLLQQRTLQQGRVTWKEDVRQWHPGQTWIWEPGGFGVLDPGINAISILTQIIAEPIFVRAARLYVPSNCAAPIAAELEFITDRGVGILAELDFRHTGRQTWDIDLATDQGPVKLSAGGGQLTVGTDVVPPDPGALAGEYEDIYRRFAALIFQEQSEADVRPLRLVADIFLTARYIGVEPFVP